MGQAQRHGFPAPVRAQWFIIFIPLCLWKQTFCSELPSYFLKKEKRNVPLFTIFLKAGNFNIIHISRLDYGSPCLHYAKCFILTNKSLKKSVHPLFIVNTNRLILTYPFYSIQVLCIHFKDHVTEGNMPSEFVSTSTSGCAHILCQCFRCCMDLTVQNTVSLSS